MRRPDPEIVEIKELSGTKSVFFIRSENKLYVSPAIMRLIKEEYNLIKDTMVVEEMPIDPDTKEALYKSFNEWYEKKIKNNIVKEK
jgi:hypothetical protein